MRVIGIDPGKTTGAVLCNGQKVIEGLEIRSFGDLHAWLEGHIESGSADLVVMEDFFVSRRASDAKSPLGAIGVVRALTELYGFPLVLQSPALLQGSHAVREGYGSPHIRSALTHVRAYLARENPRG